MHNMLNIEGILDNISDLPILPLSDKVMHYILGYKQYCNTLSGDPMSPDSTPDRQLRSLFSQQPCWMIEPLAAELQYSIPSVRRFLSKIGYYSSFTHNGGWYTLRWVPRFNPENLWFYNNIGFSSAGSLTKTLIDMTTRSPAGMTAEQLGRKLRCRCHSILVQLYRQGRLQRLKQGRSHLYIAADPNFAAIQRQAMTINCRPAVQLPAEVAVLVLAEFIRNPKLSFEQLSDSMTRNKGVTVKVAQIERLFDQYGLKKTT